MTDTVDVWLVDTSGEPSDELAGLLEPAERQRAEGIRQPADVRRYVVAHGAMRRIVADRLGTTGFRWVLGPQGKPFVDGGAVQVNLSHSGDFALVALSPLRPVGVDLEQVRARLDVTAMAARYYPASEAALVTGPDAFALLWTRKEALVKAAGGRLTRGLAVPVAGPSPVLAEHDGPYRIADLDAPAGFRAAVALAGAESFTVRQHRFYGPKAATHR